MHCFLFDIYVFLPLGLVGQTQSTKFDLLRRVKYGENPKQAPITKFQMIKMLLTALEQGF